MSAETERGPDGEVDSVDGADVARLEKEVDLLRRAREQLRLELEAVRRDASVRLAELEEELRVQREACSLSQKESEAVQGDIARHRAIAKELKAQNLALRYHLNGWGIPIDGTGKADELLAKSQLGLQRYFPTIAAEKIAGSNPTVSVRGELSTFNLVAVLGLLEANSLVGVLTVVSDLGATKLFIENSYVRLAAWNRRNCEFGLPRLLVESEILSEPDLEHYREENLYDFEIANRLVYEGKLDVEGARRCLAEYCVVLLTQILQESSGYFFVQLGRPTAGDDLCFRVSITDLLLQAVTQIDEESRDFSELTSGLAMFDQQEESA